MAWDREFNLHVQWRLRDETAGQPIVPVRQSMAPKPEPAESQKRFVILKPGQSLSKAIELAGQLKSSVLGHSTHKN